MFKKSYFVTAENITVVMWPYFVTAKIVVNCDVVLLWKYILVVERYIDCSHEE
jgi:hypothetical protein